MLKLAKLILFIMLVWHTNAQNVHFVYIENLYKEPFSINLNNTIYETGEKHFIIIPNLNNGNYMINFIGENYSNSKFNLVINNADLGFTFKKNADNDWVLFDLNNFNTIAQEGKTVPVIVPIQNEAKPSQPTEIISKNYVKKISTTLLNNGVEQVYIDVNDNLVDTIKIIITEELRKLTDTIKEAIPILNKEQKMVGINNDAKIKKSNNCKTTAKENDVSEFSVYLQNAISLKNKLKIASLKLKEKCYSTNQLKRLSVLFINDSGKFNFFKLALNAISDENNISVLVAEINDESLKNEFIEFINYH